MRKDTTVMSCRMLGLATRQMREGDACDCAITALRGETARGSVPINVGRRVSWEIKSGTLLAHSRIGATIDGGGFRGGDGKGTREYEMKSR